MIFFEKGLDFFLTLGYNSEAVWDTTNAAIAQQVERILGKDEVASSNLASSSIKTPKPFGFGVFIFDDDRFENLNTTVRGTVVRRVGARRHLNFCTFPCKNVNKSG